MDDHMYVEPFDIGLILCDGGIVSLYYHDEQTFCSDYALDDLIVDASEAVRDIFDAFFDWSALPPTQQRKYEGNMNDCARYIQHYAEMLTY